MICEACGEALAKHIGNKPCVETSIKPKEERQRASAERSRDRQLKRLFGPDAK